jgi:L,D-peptidoglycan transpeptidase YkuD (ErfK/YbiS/YcfS/YnhG family)
MLQIPRSVSSEHAVIDYNRSPAVPGKGSAFFLHVSTGKPTTGCVFLPTTSWTP